MDQDEIQPQPPLPEPVIIPRSQHNISRKNIDPDALKVLYRLHRFGFAAYLVGGSVRDLQLGRRPKDFDVGTDARPSEVQKLFRNSRVIGRRFRLVQVIFRGGKVIEVSTFRRANNGDGDEVLMANNTFGTPAEDALRRDLTINALFYNVADFSIVDYVGGMEDLRQGLIRGVGDADMRFHRDPVRVLRAVRHAARINFTLTPETLEAIAAHRQELSVCPPSRVRDELMRDLKGGSAAAWLELAHQTEVLYSLFPNLEPHFGPPESPLRAHARELLERVDQALAQGEFLEDPVVLAALLWPILESQALEMDLPSNRQGRSQWAFFVRDALPELTQPMAFAKRVMERGCQILGVLAFVRPETAADRLPKKVSEKGYFRDACRLAQLLGWDLGSLDQAAPSPARRSRRRRRRRRKKPAATPQNQP